MRLAHCALWTKDLDEAARFWTSCFGAEVGSPYHSRRREGFISRFVTLPDGLKIELMTGPWIATADGAERVGWDHIAISLGSRQAVDEFAAKSKRLGMLAADARETGDGFYEAIIRAPDGTSVEITA